MNQAQKYSGIGKTTMYPKCAAYSYSYSTKHQVESEPAYWRNPPSTTAQLHQVEEELEKPANISLFAYVLLSAV